MSRTTAPTETAEPGPAVHGSAFVAGLRPLPDADSVIQGGRRKAYRPLPTAERRAAVDAALAAWARGDWFETHELLEPAWMGTANPAERNLYQGLIKLAAAFVHQARGNRAGVTKNIVGARERIAAAAVEAADLGGAVEGFEPAALLTTLVALERQATTAAAAGPAAEPSADITAATPRVQKSRLGAPVALAILCLTPPELRRTAP